MKVVPNWLNISSRGWGAFAAPASADDLPATPAYRGSIDEVVAVLYQIDPSVYAYATAAEALYIAQSIDECSARSDARQVPQQEQT